MNNNITYVHLHFFYTAINAQLARQAGPHEQGVHYQALLFIQNISPCLIG